MAAAAAASKPAILFVVVLLYLNLEMFIKSRLKHLVMMMIIDFIQASKQFHPSKFTHAFLTLHNGAACWKCPLRMVLLRNHILIVLTLTIQSYGHCQSSNQLKIELILANCWTQQIYQPSFYRRQSLAFGIEPLTL